MEDIREKWESCLHVLKIEEEKAFAKTTCPGAYEKDGVLLVDKRACYACHSWKGWDSMTEKEIARIRYNDCAHCGFCGGMAMDCKKVCNYISFTGRKRPCKPGDCRAAGVFMTKRERKKIWRLRRRRV